MPITDILNKNADFYPADVSLVEINPKLENQARMTWREYSLIESNPSEAYRKSPPDQKRHGTALQLSVGQGFRAETPRQG